MWFADKVYEPYEVNDAVLLKLINTKPVQRLKHISQAGASPLVIQGRNTTRYEHSLGVMHLLQHLNATLEEQIAGLLHDVPHTAYSHVIDYVFENDAHEYHEHFLETMVKNSNIPSILQRHGLDVDYILDEHNFPLLERPSPDLCADRVDYTLRDRANRIGGEEVCERMQEYYDALTVVNNKMVFNNKDLALRFAKDYLEEDRSIWSVPREVAIYQVMANALKEGLNTGVLSETDLFGTEQHVYKLLKESNNKKIHENLNLLNPSFDIILDNKDYEYEGKFKLRYINPQFLNGTTQLKKVSDVFPEFIDDIENHKARHQDRFYYRIKRN